VSVSIVGLDPGFASLGWAHIRADKGGTRTLVARGVIRTEPSAKKRRIRVLDVNLERIGLIAKELRLVLQTAAPAVIAVEGYSGLRQASAALKMGLAWGATVAVAVSTEAAVVEFTRRDVQIALGLPKKSSKEDVQRAVATAGCGVDDVPAGIREHAADAVAVALAACDTYLVRGILAAEKQQHG